MQRESWAGNQWLCLFLPRLRVSRAHKQTNKHIKKRGRDPSSTCWTIDTDGAEMLHKRTHTSNVPTIWWVIVSLRKREGSVVVNLPRCQLQLLKSLSADGLRTLPIPRDGCTSLTARSILVFTPPPIKWLITEAICSRLVLPSSWAPFWSLSRTDQSNEEYLESGVLGVLIQDRHTNQV